MTTARDTDPSRLALRQRMVEARQALDEDDHAAASMAVLTRLARIQAVRHADVVSGYRAVRGELDIDAALELLRSEGATVTVPAVRGEDLEFLPFELSAPTVAGDFGIPEPIVGDPVEVAGHDVMLVPVVAFDRAGNRLGMGRGFYDRALADLTADRAGPIVIGVAHALQEVPALEAQSWDVSLDAIVTEDEVIVVTQRLAPAG